MSKPVTSPQPSKKEINDFIFKNAGEGNIEAVRKFIKKYGDEAINLQEDDHNRTAIMHGRTALMVALGTGQDDVVKLLIEHGADTYTIKDKFGRTAVEYAQMSGEAEMVDLILKAPQITEKYKEKQALLADIADFSPALKRAIPATRPLIASPRKGMKP